MIKVPMKKDKLSYLNISATIQERLRVVLEELFRVAWYCNEDGDACINEVVLISSIIRLTTKACLDILDEQGSIKSPNFLEETMAYLIENNQTIKKWKEDSVALEKINIQKVVADNLGIKLSSGLLTGTLGETHDIK